MPFRIQSIKKKPALFYSLGVLLIAGLACPLLLSLHHKHQADLASAPMKNGNHQKLTTPLQEMDTLSAHRYAMELAHSLKNTPQEHSLQKDHFNISNLSSKSLSPHVTTVTPPGQNNGVPILELHSIAFNPSDPYCISPKNFDAEMKVLSEAGYHTITFSDLERAWYSHAPLPSKPIMLTFDDGYEDNYTTAYPILKKYHLKATIFMVSGFENKPNFLKWDQMTEMENSGLIDIQSHTVDHHNLTKISLDEAKKEIFDSKAQLASHLPDPIIAFCYPNGGFNAQIVKFVQQAGYVFATTGEHGYASLMQGPFTLDRELISGFESPQAFAKQFA